MLELVTVDEARAHLRIDDYDSGGGPDDLWLAIWIPAVSEAVALWLKDSWRLFVEEVDSEGNIVRDSNGDPVPAEDSDGPIIRMSVKAAALLELASQYRFREGEGKDNAVPAHEGYGHTLTSKAAVAILTALRRPTVA